MFERRLDFYDRYWEIAGGKRIPLFLIENHAHGVKTVSNPIAPTETCINSILLFFNKSRARARCYTFYWVHRSRDEQGGRQEGSGA